MKPTIPIPVALALGILVACPSGQAAAQDVDALKSEAFEIIDANMERIGRIGDAIFSYSEIGFQEFKTIDLVTRTLEAEGFEVETGVAGMPTAYKATYGSGSPVLGLMSDFDGVPGTSQMPVSLVHDPIVPGGPGHGEGHNTNQPALLGAAIAVKEVKDAYDLPGTIVVYGGPAEELVASRGYMVNAGLFDGVDAMMDAHVGSDLSTSYGLRNLAIISVQWTFRGTQAHGARAWEGRSALDGVELMDVGMNMIREHMEPEARIHYVIPEGGKQPNVVPAEAMVWYYFRHESAEEVWSLFERARAAAEGAAMASGTEVQERILSASWPFNGNQALAELMQENIELVGMPEWSEEDQAFARALQKSFGNAVVGLETEVGTLSAPTGQGSSSSDAGDLTWQAPYVRLSFPSKPPGGLAGHHWSAAVGPTGPVAHKGTAAGSKVLAATLLDMMVEPETLAAIKADFAEQLAAYPPWKSMIPPDAKPPIHLNTEEMARYREALAPYEYDPESEQSYYEFLGITYPPEDPETAIGKASNVPPQSDDSSMGWSWREGT